VNPNNDQHILDPTIIRDGDKLTLSFTRNLVVDGVPEILSNGDTPILYAYGDIGGGTKDTPKGFYHHDDKKVADLNFATGGVSIPVPIKVHATLMYLGWTVIIPTGVIVARFFREANLPAHWMKIHMGINLLGLALSVSGFIVALVKLWSTSEPLHLVIGMITMFLGMQQPINAFLRPHKPGKGETPTLIRRIWVVWHKWSGRVAVLLAITQCYIGFNIVKPGTKWVVGYSVSVGIFVLTFLYLEITSRMTPDPKKRAYQTVPEAAAPLRVAAQ